MPLSISMNVGPMLALQGLGATSPDREGSRGATYARRPAVARTETPPPSAALAEQVRDEIGGMQAVVHSLNTAKSTIDVAMAAGERIATIIDRMQEIAWAALAGDDPWPWALDGDFARYRSDIEAALASASFNGVNLLSGGGESRDSEDSLSAILSFHADGGSGAIPGGWSLEMLEIGNQRLSGAISDPLAMVDLATEEGMETAQDTLLGAKAATRTALRALEEKAARIDTQLAVIGAAHVLGEQRVDGAMTKDSVGDFALELSRQLTLHPLAIANQTPQALLSLLH